MMQQEKQEVGMVSDLDENWRKSTYSGSSANCVEVKSGPFENLYIRDSKNNDSGHLNINFTVWKNLLIRIKKV
jgi:hypothetical protein